MSEFLLSRVDPRPPPPAPRPPPTAHRPPPPLRPRFPVGAALRACGRRPRRCCGAPAWRVHAPCGVAPTRQDYAEEGEARPLSRDELTAKTIHGLHKREAKENKFKEQRRNKRLVRNKARQL